ncbi:nucleotide excision repair endonuclease [Aliifodinibius sp. S!AR15-10]|uniref:nucleotide excision repair endonuclease n=1 Tax=Aliifodinibius sp. S!AR15-10 TaxID=2950437 RepID=UPI002860ECD5|nr:nucleotide excision repair endonuclease [Aliifodinibius sp. S!AR15-10]MDR8392804.1 nucleotide excision repair endonuclease [Aliifodinibius sp. S!AR15-10]
MKNSEQQRLFNHYNPLEDRLGTDFFDALPKKPGIYKMYGRDGMLLYVGKAKNLRNRLFTYRRAKVGKSSRKTIRLIRMVHDIQYELCKNEKQALLRENKLIRQKQPEFNHAKKSPETYYFIHVKQEENYWTFKLNMRQYSEKEWHTYGAFKGHVVVRKALGALFRLLYIAEHKVDSAHHLPSILLKNLTPMNYSLNVSDEHIISTALLEKLFIGSSDELFEIMLSHFREQELLDKYIGKLLLEDFEALKRFYENCSQRNHQIVQHLDLDTHIIPQQKLDDYLIEMALD